ncbi:MAG: excinuclease ABC subunit C [Epulopiscium sp. Nele67-Bin001]|nr:MAG: excinuclease ABC subunit C [Epulopiscium sp. Nele67-Bin001]
MDLKNVPTTCGVYLMKDELDNIIYIGKAVNLKNRLKQYFTNNKTHSIKVIKMVENIASFEYIITQSEVEALVLECNLIKKYQPKYNIRLKDDKHYPYIKIDVNNAFPKVSIVRAMKKDGAKYFGPYTDVAAMYEIIEIIKTTWQLRTCKRKLMPNTKPCLNMQIARCVAPCKGECSQQQYKEMVNEVISFLNGNYKHVLQKLEAQMTEAADDFKFERAAILRDQISAIKKIEQKQNATSSSMKDHDIIAYATGKSDTLIQVYFVRLGKLVGREHFIFHNTQDEKIETVFRNFIVQFYETANFIPKEIVVDIIPDELELLKQYLANIKGSKVNIKVPQKGEKYNLLQLARKNALISFEQFGDRLIKQNARTTQALEELMAVLNVSSLNRIEAYDISNTSGVQSVGAMVVFENGKPKKSAYRKYKIKTVIGPNDCKSIEEVIERRINNLGDLPDLMLIDGGKGQVAAANNVLKKYGVDIVVCGMIKDDRHKTRAVLYNGKEVDIAKNTEGFKLVARIQDEVHRFAIEYHKKVRANSFKLQ